MLRPFRMVQPDSIFRLEAILLQGQNWFFLLEQNLSLTLLWKIPGFALLYILTLPWPPLS